MKNNNNYPESVEKIVNDYLARLKDHLKGMSEEDKDESVKEIESHIYESYKNDQTENEVDRILNVLRKLGEPSKVFSEKMPDSMVKMGKNKNLPLYILGGVLIGLFGIPLGIGGLSVLLGIVVAVVSLIIAYFATAVSLVVAGFVGVVVSIVHIVDPTFLDRTFAAFDLYVEHHHYLSPTAEGIAGLLVSMLLAGLGVVLLFLGKYIFRGTRFLFNLTLEKIREFRKKKRPALQEG